MEDLEARISELKKSIVEDGDKDLAETFESIARTQVEIGNPPGIEIAFNLIQFFKKKKEPSA